MLPAESEFNGSELENRNANEETSLCLLTPHHIERKGVKAAHGHRVREMLLNSKLTDFS